MPKSIKNWKVLLPIIFLFFINFLVILYVYSDLYHNEVMSLTTELDSLIEKNHELTETLKKLKRAEQGKR
jgi:cell division protein FtsL